MKIFKDLTKLRVKSDPTLNDSYEKKNLKNKKIGNAKAFTNVKSIDEEGVIELKSSEYAILFSVQAVDFSLSSSIAQDSFYSQLSNLYSIKGLNIRQYKLDKNLNFNSIEENLNYQSLSFSSDEKRSKLLEDHLQVLEGFKSATDAKSSMYFWIIISNSKDKVLELGQDVKSRCANLNTPIYLERVSNYLEIKQFLAELYFQDCSLGQLLYTDLYDAIIPTTVREKVEYLKVDDYYVQMLGVKRLSATVYKNFMDGICNIPNIKSVLCTYDDVDTISFINVLDYNYRSLLVDRNMSKKLSDVTEMDEQDRAMQLLMNDLKTGNEFLKSFTLVLAIYAKSLEELKKINKMLQAYSTSSSVNVDVCYFRQYEAWQAFDITATNFADYTKPQPTLTIAASFSATRSFFLDSKGFYLGYDNMSGLPIYFDPFLRDFNRKNSNMAVIGTSGSGKSFTMKKMLIDSYSLGSKLFILDVENEYQDLVTKNGGHFVDLFSRKGGMINPLQIRFLPSEDENDDIDNSDKLLSEQTSDTLLLDSPLAKHLGYLEQFFKTAYDEISENELIKLLQILEELYSKFGITKQTTVSELRTRDNKDYPIFTDLINLIHEKEEHDYGAEVNKIIKKLVLKLSRYESGIDEFLFNGHTNIDLDNDIICFNLQELFKSDNERLIQTQLLSLLSYLNTLIVGNKVLNSSGTKKQNIVVAVDEFHVYKEYLMVLIQLSQLCRRVRKYDCAFLFATQSISELIGNDNVIRYSQAILDNCQYQFIGNLKENDLNAYNSLMESNPLTDTQMHFLQESMVGDFLITITSKLRLLCHIDATAYEKELMGE